MVGEIVYFKGPDVLMVTYLIWLHALTIVDITLLTICFYWRIGVAACEKLHATSNTKILVVSWFVH